MPGIRTRNFAENILPLSYRGWSEIGGNFALTNGKGTVRYGRGVEGPVRPYFLPYSTAVPPYRTKVR